MPSESKPQREPQHVGMDIPLKRCKCGDCEYARWFEALSEEERRKELELIYAYSDDLDD